VASPGFGVRGHKTKRKLIKGDSQEYCEIHVINSDKAKGLYIFTGQTATRSQMSEFVRV